MPFVNDNLSEMHKYYWTASMLRYNISQLIASKDIGDTNFLYGIICQDLESLYKNKCLEFENEK